MIEMSEWRKMVLFAINEFVSNDFSINLRLINQNNSENCKRHDYKITLLNQRNKMSVYYEKTRCDKNYQLMYFQEKSH